jgi:hypothetical protein
VTAGDLEHLIYWGVFDEMTEYLRPIVEVTLDAAARYLSKRPSNIPELAK